MSAMTSTTIPCTLKMVSHPGEPEVPAIIGWDSLDPLAVTIDFPPPVDKIWFFSVELLTKGMRSGHPVGLGHVKIGPAELPWLVTITLSSADKMAVFTVARVTLAHIMHAARGTKNLDLTDEIDAFLASVMPA